VPTLRPEQPAAALPLIYIDPAMRARSRPSPPGTYEKDVTLAMAMELQRRPPPGATGSR
jgi:hypothetical protein